MRPWDSRLVGVPGWAVDLALGLALAIVDVATLLSYRQQLHPLGVALLLVVAQNLPLVTRRTWPIATFVVIGGARVTYDLIGLALAPLPLGPAIAVYTVADRCSPKVRRIVAVLLVAGLVTSQLAPGHNEPYDGIEAALIMATAWMAGALNRARRTYVGAIETRASKAEAAASEERGLIARELHDVVAHHVSLMAVQAEAALSLLPDRPIEATGSVEIIGSTGRQALTELRRLLGVLRGPAEQVDTAPTPSLTDVDDLLERVREAGLRVTFAVSGQPSSLSPSVDLTAYRIVQEALTNVVRHSPTSNAAVTVSYEPCHVTVSVVDSRPEPVEALASSRAQGAPSARPVGARITSGFGLAGIAERVASCGGSLSVGPDALGGFAVSARLPLK